VRLIEGEFMLIGLHDSDAEHIKRKSFPNYALMKISAWHKRQGDVVEWWAAINNTYYERVYSSKVLSYTPINPYLPECTIKGGTGYDIKAKLPPEIDAIFPDYSIYPDCDYAIGFITRGCPNNCRWCCVPAKEGGIKPYRRWHELVRSDSDKLVLTDNNILACEYGISELESLIDSGYKIDLNQGMDASRVDERIADIISRLKWIKYIRFSCDTLDKTKSIDRVADLLGRCGIKPYRLFVYLLVTDDLQDAAERVERLKLNRGINIYAQPERNESMGITPNAAQLEFCQRYIYKGIYKKESWSEYCERRGFVYGA
jgi:hypothetical protein